MNRIHKISIGLRVSSGQPTIYYWRENNAAVIDVNNQGAIKSIQDDLNKGYKARKQLKKLKKKAKLTWPKEFKFEWVSDKFKAANPWCSPFVEMMGMPNEEPAPKPPLINNILTENPLPNMPEIYIVLCDYGDPLYAMLLEMMDTTPTSKHVTDSLEALTLHDKSKFIGFLIIGNRIEWFLGADSAPRKAYPAYQSHAYWEKIRKHFGYVRTKDNTEVGGEIVTSYHEGDLITTRECYQIQFLKDDYVVAKNLKSGTIHHIYYKYITVGSYYPPKIKVTKVEDLAPDINNCYVRFDRPEGYIYRSIIAELEVHPEANNFNARLEIITTTAPDNFNGLCIKDGMLYDIMSEETEPQFKHIHNFTLFEFVNDVIASHFGNRKKIRDHNEIFSEIKAEAAKNKP